MILFLILAIIQSSLLIPLVFIFASHWEEREYKGVQQTLFQFICIMSVCEAFFWGGSEIALTSLTLGLPTGLTVEAGTLSVNVIFLLSIVLAIFNEVKLARSVDGQ